MIIVHDILKWDDVWSNFIRHKTHALWSSSSELISLGTFKINRILGFIRTTGENLMMLIVLRLENKSIYSNPSGKASSNSHYKRRICLLCMLMGQVIFFFYKQFEWNAYITISSVPTVSSQNVFQRFAMVIFSK